MQQAGTVKRKIYWLERNGTTRAYGDFRSLAKVGGKNLEPLVAPGEKFATTDADQAQRAYDLRHAFLTKELNRVEVMGVTEYMTLGAFIPKHLEEKRNADLFEESTLRAAADHLATAKEYFEKDGPRDITTITVVDVMAYRDWLKTTPAKGRHGKSGSGKLKAPATVRKYLNALSNLFVTAIALGHMKPVANLNPVAACPNKPSSKRPERSNTDVLVWLSVDQAARLLEAARTMKYHNKDTGKVFYPMLATMLLTGARVAEVCGLLVTDIHFETNQIWFHPNDKRNIKTNVSVRFMRLFPQLKEILETYLTGENKPAGRFLFPAVGLDSEADQFIGDFRKTLKTCADHAKLTATIQAKSFRHTYVSARAFTTLHGMSVPMAMVAQEIGHGGDAITKAVYAHLNIQPDDVRHRGENVEYRVRPALVVESAA